MSIEAWKQLSYDFKASGARILQESEDKAKAYLHELDAGVNDLYRAKESFVQVGERLTSLLHALKIRNERQFSYHSIWFKGDFNEFEYQLKEFLSIKHPPRQSFYIADLYRESGTSEQGVIQQYNNRLNVIKRHMQSLKDGKQRMLDAIKEYSDSLEQTEQDNRVNPLSQCVDAIPMWLPGASTRSAHGAEPLPQAMGSGMNTLEPRPETSSAMRPENERLVTFHTAITKIEAILQRIEPWEEDPRWFPLLTEEEQSEFGQRMFLHAMDQTDDLADEQLLRAKIFLRQHAPNFRINRLESDLSSHELADILRSWQIKKCGQLIDFLSTLTQETVLPEHDPDGLLEWLKTKKHDQSAIELLREILVSPCCFSQLSFKLAMQRLEVLLINYPINTLIEQYRENYWGVIRKKSDQLIQLPTFSANILPRDCMEKDYQSKNANVVSPVMHQLAKKLMIDLKQLKEALEKNQDRYLADIVTALKNGKAFSNEAKKNQVHQQGVQSIRRSYRSYGITSPGKLLSLYLYHARSNEEEKKRRVPTKDDLIHVIYTEKCQATVSPPQIPVNRSIASMRFRKFRAFFSLTNLTKVISRTYRAITRFIFGRSKLSKLDKALFRALVKGHTESVALLLMQGANANAVGSLGFRPLLTALLAKRNMTEMMDLLLKYGADVNVVPWFRLTPLNSAILKLRLETVALFLKHGADLNLKSVGSTPLQFAVFAHQNSKSKEITLSIVKMLIMAVLLDNLNAEKPPFINKNQSISIVWDESKRMLNKKLSDTLSLWDLCKEKNENKLAFISQNEEVKKVLEALNLKERYSYLNEEIQSQIQKGVARNQALGTASESIFIPNSNKKLNESAWKKILKNAPQDVSQEELRHERRTASLFFNKLPSNDEDSSFASATTSHHNMDL